jgi:Cobalamin biosynthesis protein CobT VWA domain/Streptomycin adenylyltransferase
MATSGGVRMSYLLDLYGVQKLARALADSNGISIIYEKKAGQPRTDGRTIYVPFPSSAWSDATYTKWLYTVFHEIGHNVPKMRDCFDIPKKKKIHMQSFLGVTMNLLEDYRQEYYKYDEYLGKKSILSKGRGLFIWDQINLFKEFHDKYHKALVTLSAWEVKVREDWQTDIIGCTEAMQKWLDPEAKEWFKTLESGPYKNLLNDIDTAEDTYKLAKKIITEVFKMDVEEEEKKAQQQYKEADGGGGAKKGDEKGDKEDKVRAGGKVKYDDVLIHKHDDKRTSYAPVEIDYSGSTKVSVTYDPWPVSAFQVKDLTSVTSTDYRSYDISTETTNFSNALKRHLMILMKDKYEYGKKRGYMHNKNLYRVTVPNAGSYSEKIFKQKRESSVLNTAVSVLVDMSGSMGGHKMVHAAHSAILLNDSIAKLGVPVEIAGFTEDYNGPIHCLFKRFDTKCEAAHLRDRILEGTRHMEENADGDSVLFAYSRLKGRKEKKKLLIVLSDGQPAAHRGSGIHGFTKKVVKAIENEGRVDIYGLGIMSNAVKQFYKQFSVIEDSSELEVALLTILKNKLFN